MTKITDILQQSESRRLEFKELFPANAAAGYKSFLHLQMMQKGNSGKGLKKESMNGYWKKKLISN